MTRSGVVKILDFGLARRETATAPNGTDPTLPNTLTTPGMLVGTAGYMSPEQAAGRKADFRSDQFALGVVLHELLSGRRAFMRQTLPETLTAIIREEPEPLPPLPPVLDGPVRSIVARCLEKEADGRYGSTRDLARDLKEVAALARGGSSRRPIAPGPAIVAAPVHPRRKPILFASLAFLVAVALGFWGGTVARRNPLPQFRQLTFRRGTVWAARFTPGGENLVYGASWDGASPRLFTARVDGGRSSPLSAPDGNLLAVSAASDLAVALNAAGELPGMTVGTLARMPISGGAPREVLKEVEFAEFLPDSAGYAIVRRVAGKARLEVPGKRVLFETPGWISHPRSSPDGKLLAFLHHPSVPDDRADVMFVPTDGGPSGVLSSGWTSCLGLAWAASGREVWFTATGESGARVLHAVDLAGRLRTVYRMAGNLTLHDISRDGRVLASRDTMRIGLIRGREGELDVDESWLDSSLVTDVSVDGRTFLFTEFGEGGGPRYSAYLRKTDGSPALRLGDGIATALSPDGKRVLVIVPADPPVLTVLPSGAGEAETVQTLPVAGVSWAAWFPDGKALLLAGSEAGKGIRLWRLEGTTGPAVPLSPEGVTARFSGGIVSIDGRMVSAATDDGGLSTYRADGGGHREVPGVTPGIVPVGWSPDGANLIGFVREGPSARLLRVEAASGKSTVIRLLRPLDAAGVIGIPTVYSYGRLLSELYVVEGLK
jgi:hypothetical protein